MVKGSGRPAAGSSALNLQDELESSGLTVVRCLTWINERRKSTRPIKGPGEGENGRALME